MNKNLFVVAILAAAMLLNLGCATAPYQYGNLVPDSPNICKMPPDEPQIERGAPHGFLDFAGSWLWPNSLFGKLILWNIKVQNHEISRTTEDAIRDYLAANDLAHVKVRLNQYAVGAEWRRWKHNYAIGGGWKYTVGVLNMLYYTVLPGRFFGGDHYNPYSNTINIYSDVSAIGLHESGHSKDFARRTWKGTYSILYGIVPLFNLYPEGIATHDAMSYLRAQGDLDNRKRGYNILYPAYGTYIGGDFGSWTPFYYPILAGAAVVGHVAGRTRSAMIDEEAPQAVPPEVVARVQEWKMRQEMTMQTWRIKQHGEQPPPGYSPPEGNNVVPVKTPDAVNPAPGKSLGDVLREIKNLKDKGLITDDEYQAKRRQILDRYSE